MVRHRHYGDGLFAPRKPRRQGIVRALASAQTRSHAAEIRRSP